MDNKQIARVLRETAQLLEIDGANHWPLGSNMQENGTPPGIGERMVEHLQEIVKTGDYSLRKKLLKKYPATILDILQLQSLGLADSTRTSGLLSVFRQPKNADIVSTLLTEPEC